MMCGIIAIFVCVVLAILIVWALYDVLSYETGGNHAFAYGNRALDDNSAYGVNPSFRPGLRCNEKAHCCGADLLAGGCLGARP